MFQFVIKSLRHFRKQHIGVFLATVLSTAVLTGALIVGDSVVYSLKHLVDLRLGKVSNVLVGGDRFVTDELTHKISHNLNIKSAPVLYLETISIVPEKQIRQPNVQLLGIDSNFWNLSNINMPNPVDNKVIISTNLASKQKLKIGDEFLLRVRNADIIPLNAPFTNDDEQSIAIRVEVLQIADDDHLGRFSLKNDQKSPYNIFINKEFIGSKVGLSELSNIILTDSKASNDILNQSLSENFSLKDAGITLKNLEDQKQIDLSSDRIFIDNSLSDKIEESGIEHSKILTYFVNSFKSNGSETPYSFISALDDNFSGQNISRHGIIINSWLAEDLNTKVGDSIEIDYYVIGPLRTLKEVSSTFVIEGIVPISSGSLGANLMPEFPGLADAESCGDWEAGIPVDLEKIRDKDEEYWNDYKGTPKAYINRYTGVEIWENNYGNSTSIRFINSDITLQELSTKLSKIIDPSDIGLSFINVRTAGNKAATSGVDFGELFLSLSFFIIVSALLLMVLIYSLNLNSRKHETGILNNLGFTKKQILKLRLYESLLVILIAAIVGGLCGILYNNLIISALNSIWNDAVHADLLRVRIYPVTILTGILIGITTSLITIYITTRRILNKQGIAIVKQSPSIKTGRNKIISIILSSIGLLSSIAITLYSLSGHGEINSSLILMAAFLFLTGCTALADYLLVSNISRSGSPIMSVFQLALKNAGRNRGRSIAVISLLAIGTFTIIITGSNRLTFDGSESERSSGTGGYDMWVENTIPIVQDLNTIFGRNSIGLDDDIFDNVNFIQFHNLAGDDASCLNLNQVQKPQLLGVNPYIFNNQNAFSFAKTIKETENPWLELVADYGDNVIPAIADQTVIQWGLIKSIGDTLKYINEYGDSLNLILVGGLNPSIFQGNLLIADSLFIKNFPSAAGSKIMLVETPKESSLQVADGLNNYLADFGINISQTSQRLRDFYSVTNTYLTIFMILGSLGVLIGTIGLGIVIIRNLLDRKHEIGIYSAIGYSKSLIFNIISLENIILLIVGILIGLLSAIIGILPSLVSQSFNIPGNYITMILLIVILNGLIWIYLPIYLMLRNNNSIFLGED